MAKVHTCRSCGRRVAWAKTEKGKSMPLDATDDGRPEVVLNGNIVLVDGVAVYVPTGEGQHVSHFATCPHAAEHRRR